jgi:hemolysin III
LNEWINAGTHGLASILAIPVTVLLIIRAVRFGDARGVVAVSIFGATLFLLYTVSTLYHALPSSKAKTRFRIFDHIAIYLLIAGSYTPFTLVALRGAWGWSLFGVVWGLAMCGTLLKIFFIHRFRILSVIVYIGMGWLVLIAYRPLIQVLEPLTLRLLVAGGLAYTGGVLFYANRRLPFQHGIWHLFVIAGSLLHAISIYTLFPSDTY